MEIEAQEKNISELDLKLQKEKVARLNNDNPESTRLLTEIVEYLYSKQDFPALFEQLKQFSISLDPFLKNEDSLKKQLYKWFKLK